ncbi:MAG: NADH-quinone oxidoreductase subunit L, partial [Candidatus Wenzhouxiangella sp. M2_3B_020]
MTPLWLVPAAPLAGFVVLALAGGRMSTRAVGWLGCGTVALSFVLAVVAAAGFGDGGSTRDVIGETVFEWFAVGDLAVDVGLHLDALSLWMMLIVTGVGLLVHVFSAAFMAGDPGYARYFAYLNLFVAAMLVLVLADDLVVLYAGWEAVGLCSYLLIGHWYDDAGNGFAARKAFVVTRLGDVALLLAILALFAAFGTLEIEAVLAAAGNQWTPGTGIALLVAVLVLVGAIGKSAQFPLHVWLPDAMAGPSPVSALIHAATMVTAGVYLVARLHPLFELSAVAMGLVVAVGVATLLIAGLSALAQRDIKRVLAYSTISQIGYMFVALGLGAWSAAIFHLMTHAFFKALLFLGAGLVIRHLHGEHDVARMGGLRRTMPWTAAAFTIGAASLAALPLVTAGFWSKEAVLGAAWEA